MKRVLFGLLCAGVLATTCWADVYLQSPGGSNNRLNERSAARQNGNRLFDSQNNDRGGYNVGQTDPNDQNDATDETKQYQYTFYQGSTLKIEWTAQHGCSGDGENDGNKVNCNMVIQYMCDDNMRNGQTTNTIQENDPTNTATGRHEPPEWYTTCKTATRNKGLFTADQKLQGDTRIYTRQNPQGTRRGLECPEERDYYPYWDDSNPWRDIAVLTDNSTLCNYYKTNSINKKKGLPDVDCQPAPWSRSNHLGNSRNLEHASYDWLIPTSFPTNTKCVLRLRYNISTDDFDPFATFAANNTIIQQNPTVDVGADNQGLRLAINTAQTGRVFQDRTHIFKVQPKPTYVGNNKIWNVLVRGKRGNIVQTYPAVEYDFVPNKLSIGRNDFIHVQWTGSNRHNNGHDGGDGQTGDAGEGRGGTDRHNIVEIPSLTDNYPTVYSQNKLWKAVRTINGNAASDTDRADLAVKFATSGKVATAAAAAQLTDAQQDTLLDNSGPSFTAPLIQLNAGTYYYMCSRNNNFSNRSQKGMITVV
eukprot:Colp12_sorted_trinity150504_noHs@12449